MLKIIILHEPMVRKRFAKKRNQGAFQNAAIQGSFHDAFENADLRCAVSADTGPNVHFQWMLWFGLPFRWFVDFSITSAAELLQGNRAFIAKDHVVECISSV